ncbi:DUF5999 family protein [Wenjunlia tyrosinilytica]|uniref:Uncharacterized protein n=1 Tax=Wenjunlia tyrosinilytica TaxID=1544741 RepID=A0A917ZWX5_9ACTN|nr:DUF5999 family protein [Wenjunlia tyrosinilytica]GGO98638.1 hypothetical protein GCM10012280_63240 [Wenjunlia tyrosinilytica]
MAARRARQRQSPCPSAQDRDREAGRTVAYYPQQGWGFVCNVVLVFEVMSISELQGLV